MMMNEVRVAGRACDPRRDLRVGDGVDDQRAEHARDRPRGEQPTVDRADLVGAEQVTQVGGHGREARRRRRTG